jgi:hypothetical protein
LSLDGWQARGRGAGVLAGGDSQGCDKTMDKTESGSADFTEMRLYYDRWQQKNNEGKSKT